MGGDLKQKYYSSNTKCTTRDFYKLWKKKKNLKESMGLTAENSEYNIVDIPGHGIGFLIT